MGGVLARWGSAHRREAQQDEDDHLNLPSKTFAVEHGDYLLGQSG
jgi:hypothetical protein